MNKLTFGMKNEGKEVT